MKRIPILSFFSGGGFLDLGFEEAGFEIVWSNETQESFADMYQSGVSSWRVATGHKNGSTPPHLNRTSIEILTKRDICLEAFGSLEPSVFGVIGGPPCQDFSQSGKDLGVNGDRGILTRVFTDVICSLRPSFFLIENVPGLHRKKHRSFYYQMVRQLEEGKLGYLTSMRVVNALDFGVPQHRERLILIGFRKDFLGNEYGLSVLLGRDADWFPWPKPMYENAKELPWPSTSPFGIEVLPIPKNIPLELTVGRLLGNDAESLPNGQDVFTPYSKKFMEIDEGDTSGKSFKRLHRYRYSPTVCYGNNEVHLHPWKPRRLTVREALRIQSVPDAYVLPPENTLTDKFKIISNGVPTLLAKHLANAVRRYLDERILT